MQQVEQFSPSLAGIALLVGQIADGIATPFVGIESDRDTDWILCRYGKRKTWHLLGTICVLVSFPIIFTSCPGCQHAEQYAQVIYYSAFIVIFQFGWASVQISHLAMIPDLTPHSNERVELNAWRYAFTVVSNITVYSIAWLYLGLGTTEGKTTPQLCPRDAMHFQRIVWSILILGIIFSLIFHLIVRENPGYSKLQRASFISSDGVDYSLRANHLKWFDWFKVTQFYKVGFLYMGTRLTINLTQAYIPFYLQTTLMLSRESIAYIPLLMYISGFFSSLVMKPINCTLGKKWTFVAGCLIAFSGYTWIYFGAGEKYTMYGIYGVCFLLGVSGSIMLITSLGITSDLIGHNTTSGAFVFGAMSFLDKVSNGVAVMSIQYMHDNSIPSCVYYRNVLSFVCGGSTIMALIAIVLLIPDQIGDQRRPCLPNLNDDSMGRSSGSISDDEPIISQPSINGRADHDKVIAVQ
ncbi:Major facilitator superfamily domain-containing protein 12 [Halotydeus destructor]|nr:Major facilitator superfamily domain-containing protein 12 [Halotydeus destructor]